MHFKLAGDIASGIASRVPWARPAGTPPEPEKSYGWKMKTSRVAAALRDVMN
jgi:hypothetical protein